MRRFALLAALLLGCQPDVPDDDPLPPGASGPVALTRQALARDGRWAIPADVLAVANRATVTITDAGPWRGEASCSGTFTQGAQRFKAWTLAHWPQVTGVGGYSCRAINGNGAVTSIHAVGRALDIFIPLDGGQADNDLGDELANYLLVHADEMGIQRVIWDRSYWRAGNTPREGEYGGAHPHHDHLHVELSVEAAEERSPFFVAGLPPPDRGPCGPALPAAGGQIDDSDACFAAYGPAQYWRSEGGAGVGGSLLWTNAFSGANPSNWAEWRFRVAAAGDYTVAVNTVAAWSRHPATRYAVRHAGGTAEPVVDLAGRDGWTELGDFTFAANTEYSVRLFDNYAQAPGADVHLTADAVRLRPVAPPPVVDAAVPAPDAAAPVRDAQAPPVDAAPWDAGLPQDAAAPRPDARPVDPDWGTPVRPDGGPAGAVDADLWDGAPPVERSFSKITGGCAAAAAPAGPAAPSGWAGLALLGLLGLGRRRARRHRAPR